jgi:hypothetical protein
MLLPFHASCNSGTCFAAVDLLLKANLALIHLGAPCVLMCVCLPMRTLLQARVCFFRYGSYTYEEKGKG